VGALSGALTSTTVQHPTTMWKWVQWIILTIVVAFLVQWIIKKIFHCKVCQVKNEVSKNE